MVAQREVQADPAVARALTAARVIMDAGSGGLTKQQVRQRVEQYRSAELAGQSWESWDREFSRDKSRLRSVGIHLEESAEHRYRIDSASHGLKPLQLNDQERLALIRVRQMLAAESAPGLDHAFWTIGLDPVETGNLSWHPQVRSPLIGSEDELQKVIALSDIGLQKPIRFGYTTNGSMQSVQRHVLPLGLGVRGCWYLVAFDLDRQAQRIFRLDRMDSTPSLIVEASMREKADAFLPALQSQRIDVREVLESFGAHEDPLLSLRAVESLHQGAADHIPRLREPTGPAAPRSASAKLERVLNIASFLLSAGGARPSELMSRYHLNAWQLHRDLLTLQQVGSFDQDLFGEYIDVQPVPPLTSQEFLGEYLVEDAVICLQDPQLDGEGPLSRPVSLTAPGALALSVGIQAMINYTQPNAQEPALASALVSLRNALHAVMPQTLIETVEHFALSEPIGTDGAAGIIRDALSAECAVEIEYEDAEGAVSQRVVEPTQLLGGTTNSYLRGWCHRAESLRHFSLSRIRSISLLPHITLGEQARAIPAADAQALQVPRSPASVTAILRFAPFARGLADTFAVERSVAQGSSWIIQTHYRSEEALIRRILAASGAIELIAPDALREEVRRRAAAGCATDDAE